MFASRDFLSCIEQQLTERGFGKKRQRVINEKFEGLTGLFKRQGYGSQIAQSMAMNKVFNDLAQETLERAKRMQHDLQVHAENGALVQLGAKTGASVWVMDGGTGKGAGVVRAAISALQDDPRYPTISVENDRASLRDKYHALLGDAMDNFRKGFMGKQKGLTSLSDLVREIFGEATSNENVQAVAHGYKNLDKVMVQDHNNAGGSMRALDDYNLPQRPNAAALNKVPFEEWRAERAKIYNWDRMTFDDGTQIPVGDRDRLLKVIYDTFTTDGTNRIDPTSFGGRGASVGNSLDNHRFIHYQNADAWLFDNAKYGGGANVVDIIDKHIEAMAHKTSLVKKFGSNPALGMQNIANQARVAAAKIQIEAKNAFDRLAADAKRAQPRPDADIAADKKLAVKSSLRASAEAEKVIKNRLEPMFDVYTHANPMSSDSPLAASIVTTANILTAAKLGSTIFLAQGGDFAQTLAMRMLNHQSLLSGMGTYLSGVTTDFKGKAEWGARSGYIFDSHIASTNTTERFSPIATYGPAWARRVSDWNMRLSGLNRHTEIARMTVQQEFMGALMHHINEPFEQVPFNNVMARYGIGPTEWNAARGSIKPWEPEPNAKFFRPLDLLQTDLPNKDQLYSQFYSMVAQESKNAVPGATLEASVFLKGKSRPDTLPGALLHSFAMFKNFPITFMQMYGRLALSEERTASRLGFLAAIGAGATLVGAMGVQLKELSQGRTPIPMGLNAKGVPNVAFWGKAALAGGGMGIWGDFLFGGINDKGQSPAEVAAGPLAGLAHDATNLALGGPFKFVNAWEDDKDMGGTGPNFAARAVQFAKYNVPFGSVWYARLALEREVWDALDQIADPNTYRRNQAKVRQQQQQYGNTYYSAPGSGLTGNGPLLTRGLR